MSITDIREELDRSFGEGPPHRDDGIVLEAGRRRLRRRRITSATGAALAAVVVLGGVALAANDTNDARGQQDPATTPTASSTPATRPYEQVPADDPALADGEQVVLAPDGTLYVRDDVEVVAVVENPMDVAPPRHSVGVATSERGQETWWLLESYPRGSSTSSEPARQSFPDLGMWLDDQVALQQGEPTLALVHFGPDGTLVGDDGVEILEQRAGVDLGPSFAGPGDPTAVAEVLWRGDRWYVLARDLGAGPPEYFPTAASVSRPTLDGFLTYARESYDEGTGLR